MIFLAPSFCRRSPAATPASFSSWPKYSCTPIAFQLSKPELKATTGMFLALAALTAGAMASGLASVRAIPLTPLSIAVCTRLAWFGASGSLEYRSSMLSLSAAAWAPLRIRSQNESPGTSWVIIATVARGVLACPAPIPPPVSSGLPPVEEHDAIPSTSTLAPPIAASRLNLIVSPCIQCAA